MLTCILPDSGVVVGGRSHCIGTDCQLCSSELAWNTMKPYSNLVINIVIGSTLWHKLRANLIGGILA